MRIGILFSGSLPPTEGVGMYVWNLACFLRDRGHEVHLITRGGLLPVPAQKVDGIHVHRPVFWPVYPFHVHFHAIFVSKRMRELTGALDLLHIHSPETLPPETDLPMLVTVHSPLVTPTVSTGKFNPRELAQRWQAPLRQGIERALLQRANRITTVSLSVASQLGQYGMEQKTISVVGNGIYADYFVPGPQSPFTPEHPLFLAIGRLAPGKGFEDFLSACRKLAFVYPNARFVIIGGGPLEAELRREIVRSDLAEVASLEGIVTDRAVLRSYYQKAYAFVLPSHSEDLPTVLLEAMACGKAVIATDIPGTRNIICHEENGLLVQPRHPEEMARAMLRLIENPELVSMLGLAARQTVEKDFSWPVVGERILSEYHALLEQNHRR